MYRKYKGTTYHNKKTPVSYNYVPLRFLMSFLTASSTNIADIWGKITQIFSTERNPGVYVRKGQKETKRCCTGRDQTRSPRHTAPARCYGTTVPDFSLSPDSSVGRAMDCSAAIRHPLVTGMLPVREMYYSMHIDM